jgi:Na+/serine symporter
MGRLSYRNPFCERDDIYVKASDSLLLAGLLQLINYLQLTMYSPMILSDALFALTIAGCVVLFWYYIARHPFEFIVSCLCENILVIHKGAVKILVA